MLKNNQNLMKKKALKKEAQDKTLSWEFCKMLFLNMKK